MADQDNELRNLKKPFRVAILHQGFIPIYRVRFFELINEQDLIDYVVIHGDPPTGLASRAAPGPFTFPNVRVTNRELSIRGRTAIYQPIVRAVLTGSYDAVVLGHELKFLSNVLLAPLSRLRGMRVFYWGFGYHVKISSDLSGEGPMWQSRVATFSKGLLTSLAHGFLVYTETGKERLQASGFDGKKISVLRNTIDMTEQFDLFDQLKDTSVETLRHELGLSSDSTILLYVGRLLAAKEVDQLIRVTAALNSELAGKERVETVIIGSGPEEDRLRHMAADVPGVRLLGEIYDQALIARYFKVASGLVIPGFVGLAVNHAFAQGRPVITRAHELHSPEFEYIVPGYNGLVSGNGFEDLRKTVATFVGDKALQVRLAQGALETRSQLRLETMATSFHAAVSDSLLKSGRAPRNRSA
jgi:glycosyltransferase involved in cell wall biosynthesis